jgi:thiamine-monophosphate kinase
LAFTLSLSLPAANEPWVRDFSAGLADCATALGLPLVGGDTTRGPLSIAVQVHGQVPVGEALTRSGAKPGDRIMVSGSVGDGAAGLAVIQKRLTVSEADSHYLWQRFFQPQARLVLGQALRGIATAAIDISDGLLADLGHILNASAVGATLYADQLPLSAALQALTDAKQAQQWALSGGDDYELCFTVPEQALAELTLLREQLAVPLTEVGVITADTALRCLGGNGQTLTLQQQGYQHF